MKYSFQSIWNSLVVLIFLALPSAAFAQDAGTFQECVDEFIAGFGGYIAAETSNAGGVNNTCLTMKGGLAIERNGLIDTDPTSFRAESIGKVCTVDAFERTLAGKESGKWKKFLQGEGCDLVLNGGKIVFRTSVAVNGNLISEARELGVKGKIQSGLDAGDKICNLVAENATDPLPGEYTAWLSAHGTVNHASERVTHSPYPYALAEGTTVALDYERLIKTCQDGDGECILAPIDLTENDRDPDTANHLTFSPAWTGTGYNGSALTSNCSGWTSSLGYVGAIGDVTATTKEWTQSHRDDDEVCTSLSSLICIQDHKQE